MFVVEKTCFVFFPTRAQPVSDGWKTRERKEKVPGKISRMGGNTPCGMGYGVPRGGGIMEGRRMEWRIGTGIYTQRDDDRAEIG